MKEGFSLSELLIVILILSLLLIPTIFIILRYHQSTILNSAVEEIISTLQLARNLAINERKEIKVVFEGNHFFIERDGKIYTKIYNLPSHVKIKELTDGFKPVVFFPDGKAKKAGHMIIFEENSKREKRIILYNLTGKCVVR